MLAQGYAVKYAFIPEMMDSFRASFSDDSEVTYDELLRAYTAADVLLLDDITELRATDFARDALTRLVDQRYRDGGLFVATTNLDVDTMAQVWGYRLADRLFDMGSDLVRVVHMGGTSYRTGRKWGLYWPGRRRS
jgi:DNA replication protein DnaC